MRVPTLLAACSLFLVGCLSVTTTQLGPPRLGHRRPVVLADQVSVYRAPEFVPSDYEEVALLHATGSVAWSTEAGMIRKLKEEAGRLGANAIILAPERELTVREKIAIEKSNVDIGREGKAVAIYVRPSEGAATERTPEEFGAESGPGDSASAETDASYVVILENGLVVAAEAIEPWGIGQVKVTEPDGRIRYLSSNKIRSITDRNGEDQTARALDERRRLPRTTGTF